MANLTDDQREDLWRYARERGHRPHNVGGCECLDNDKPCMSSGRSDGEPKFIPGDDIGITISTSSAKGSMDSIYQLEQENKRLKKCLTELLLWIYPWKTSRRSKEFIEEAMRGFLLVGRNHPFKNVDRIEKRING